MYRFNNGLTYNNSDFNRFGYKDNDKCSFCKEEKQTSRHLFWECRETRGFWNKINNNLTEGNIRKREVFLGENEGQDAIKEMAKNNIIAMALQYIYTTNYKEGKLTTGGMWEKLKWLERVEKEIAGKNNKILRHMTKWESIDNMLKVDCFLISESNPDREGGEDSRKTACTGKRRRGSDENEETRRRGAAKRRRKD